MSIFIPKSAPKTTTTSKSSTFVAPTTSSSASTTRSLIHRPWTRLLSTLDLSNQSLTEQELKDELLARVSQLRNPLRPFGERSKESEGKIKAFVKDKPKEEQKEDKKPAGLLAPPKAGGNPLLALATTNATKEAISSSAITTAAAESGVDKDKDKDNKKLLTALDGEFAPTSAMAQDALLLAEMFEIDEVEAYVLLRSMLWNKSVPLPSSTSSNHKPTPNSSASLLPIEPSQSSTAATNSFQPPPKPRSVSLEALESSNTRLPKDILITTFRDFYHEEILALLGAMKELCVAWTNAGHDWHGVAEVVLRRVFESTTMGEEVTPPLPVSEEPALQYVKMLLHEYSIRSGLSSTLPAQDKDKSKGKGKDTALTASSLFKPSTSSPLASTAITPSTVQKEGYRSSDISQILLEQAAILELLFWFLWPSFLPWSRAALPVLQLAYTCDLGLRLPNTSTMSERGLESSTSAYLYLEEKDRSVLRKIEHLWLLLCLGVFDIAHLLNGITLIPSSPVSTDPEGDGEEGNCRRIYDPALLPRIHALMSESPKTPRYAPLLLGWAFILSCVSHRGVEMGEGVPPAYIPFLRTIIPGYSIDTAEDRLSEIGGWLSSLLAGYTITELGVLDYLGEVVKGPDDDDEDEGIFNGERGCSVGFGPPLYRVVIKRLLLAISSFMKVSLLPTRDIHTYLNLFVTIFGHGPSLPELAFDYWEVDIVNAPARVLVEMVLETYPLIGTAYPLNGSLEILIRIQRSLTGIGTSELRGGPDLTFMSRTSSLFPPSQSTTPASLLASRLEARKANAHHVFHYLDQMDTFSMVLHQQGVKNFWETYVETRDGSINGNGGGSELFYTNLHPLALPGGTVMKARSRGRLISGGSGKPLVVQWEHPHSGWSLLLEVLDECAGRLSNPAAYNNSSALPNFPGQTNTPYPKRGGNRPVYMTLSQIGIDFSSLDLETLIVEILDLFRSVLMQKDDVGHIAFFDSLGYPDDNPRSGDEETPQSPKISVMDPSTLTGGRKLEVTQVVIKLLSDALARVGHKPGRFGTTNASGGSGDMKKQLKIITSSISFLSCLARVLPNYVWPLMRSTGLLGLSKNGFGFGITPSNGSGRFGDGSAVQPSTIPQSTTASVLASERAVGSYNITLSILSLVRSLFDNAVENDITGSVSPELKGQVLLDALKFVHTSVWCDFSAWRFKRLGERFEIGKRVSRLYCDILSHWTAGDSGQGSSNGKIFRDLAGYLIDAFILKAIPATINPLVYILTIGQDMSRALKAASRATEDTELGLLLQSLLELSELLLAYKRKSLYKDRQSLFENLLCTGTTMAATTTGSRTVKAIPIDSIANLVVANDMGHITPVYAAEMLSGLVLAFSDISPSSPSLVSHMSDAEETVSQLVRIVGTVYEDPRLRKAIWRLMANSTEHQPALATLFVTGSFSTQLLATLNGMADKGKRRPVDEAPEETEKKRISALTLAVQNSVAWEELWSADPSILCSILRFLNVVWRHGLEHSAAIDIVRKDTAFWTRMAWILKQRVFPRGDDVMEVDRWTTKDYEQAQKEAYHALTQAYTIEIFAIEVGSLRRSARGTGDKTPIANKPASPASSISTLALQSFLQTEGSLAQHLEEAMKTSLDLKLHSRVAEYFTRVDDFALAHFSLEGLQSPFSPVQRGFGTDYLYQVALLSLRFSPDAIEQKNSWPKSLLNDLQAVNCNWSLVDAQIELTRSWKKFLQEGGAMLRTDEKMHIGLFKLAVSLSESIAQEERSGKTMTIVHTERLGVLLALLQSTWPLSFSVNKDVTKQFAQLLRNVHSIVISETFSPLNSIRQFSSPEGTNFHRQVLQIAYFCARKARMLYSSDASLSAEFRATVSSSMLSVSAFVSIALSESIVNAKAYQSVELDRDMELLVTVFEQSTRPELHNSPRLWLERVQELDLARASLELLTKCDLGGDFTDGETLRAQRQPLYGRHMLALQHCLSSNDAPAETLAMSGAMAAYCSISLANNLTVGTLGTFHPELPGERNPGHQAWCTVLAIVSGLIGSIGRHSSHFIETEITAFVQFYGAQLSKVLEWNINLPLSSGALEELEITLTLFYSMALGVHLRSTADRQATQLLQIFAEKSSILIQHLNYVLSHPNQLVSLFEPITSEERRSLDKDVGTGPNLASVLDLLDVEKRPFVASLTQRLHAVVRNVMATLVIVYRGDEVVVTEPEDWPTTNNVVFSTQVTLGEQATLGTFLELGNGIIDLLQYIKSSSKAKLPFSCTTPPFESSYDIAILSQTLESISLFTTTQLAIFQRRIEVGESSMEEDTSLDRVDAAWGGDTLLGRASGKRAALLSGLGNDVLSEVTGMLSKAKTTLAKVQPGADPAKGLIHLLEGFLNIRVIS